ncbi:MAG: UDP-N-acetylmuramate--L-alanine ligase [Mogibacterium sp.]|nr:UDP-N-acetylmuramate--L-alanine ligase [Mogibacterium sp.]
MTAISEYNRIHCLGIGGIGVSAIAEILQDNGHTVTGTDLKESDVTRHLEEIGIKVFYGHRAENVEGAEAVVYSAAVSPDNPEMVRASELGIPCFSRAQVLGMLMEHYEQSVAICGTHGKTTVTSMTSLILRSAGLKPTILVGGNLAEIKGNVEIGRNEYFVTEACEYMDSFLELRPTVGVVLNIDSDHLDYFKGIEHIVRSFRQFVTQIPEDGAVIAYDGNPFVRDVLKGLNNVISYGYTDSSDYHAESIRFDDSGFPEYDLYYGGELLMHIHLAVPGEHNVLNSMAAVATARYFGVDTEVIAQTLRDFHGTHRRFDYIGTTDKGAKVIDDYAHHPTEIRATLKGAQNVRHHKVFCVFQPHTYTRTLALFEDFADSFGAVDTLILTDIYAAREKDVYNVSSQKLMQRMQEKYPGREIYYISDFDEIARFLQDRSGEGDLVLTMGAGDVYKVGRLLLEGRDAEA